MERHFRITNYYDHPTNPSYTVFHYFEEVQAKTFEHYLLEANIKFEKHTDNEGHRIIFLYAVGNIHRKKAEKFNFLTLGKHREPFIPYSWMRWALFLLVMALIGLAVVGYMKSA